MDREEAGSGRGEEVGQGTEVVLEMNREEETSMMDEEEIGADLPGSEGGHHPLSCPLLVLSIIINIIRPTPPEITQTTGEMRKEKRNIDTQEHPLEGETMIDTDMFLMEGETEDPCQETDCPFIYSTHSFKCFNYSSANGLRDEE